MKGKISPRLKRILQDRAASDQLRSGLISGQDSPVQLGRTTFILRTEVRTNVQNGLGGPAFSIAQ